MSDRKSIFLLIAIMIISCIVVAGVTITISYKTAVKEERERLIETAKSHARIIESTARFNAVYSKQYPGGPIQATLRQIIDAHDHDVVAVGKTKFVLSKKEGENIVFLPRHRHDDHSKPKPVPFESRLAEPMRRALSGQSGSIIGLDYHGQIVLAAYEPLNELGLGIVTKIDMSEVRKPFVRAGIIVIIITVLVVSIGAGFFLRVTNPMVVQLEKRALELKKLNNDLKVEINERKQVEAVLRESERRLKRSQEIAHLGSWELDLTSNELTWSDEVYRIFGMEPKEFGATYEAFLEHVHPNDRAAVDAAYSGSLQENLDNYEIEHRVVRKDTGDTQFVREKCEHFRDATGKIIRSVGMIHDITERRQAEEALRNAHDELEHRVKMRTAELKETNKELKREIEERKKAERAVRESEERYALAVAGSTDGIWDWNVLSDTVFYSERFREFLGYSAEEFTDTLDAFRSCLHPNDADAFLTAVERHLQERVPYNIYYRLKTKWGEYRWFHARGQAIWDSKGKATRMSGSIQDITDRMQAEKAVRESEEKYRLLIKMLPSVVYKGYKDWSIEFFDEKIESLTGYGADEFNSRNMKWHAVILEEDMPDVKENFIRAFKTDKTFVREYRIKNNSGEILWIQDRGHIVCGSRGEIEYISGVFFDITARKRQEEKLQKSEKLLQSVFNGITDPLVLMDDRLKVRIVNQAAMRYYQVKKLEDISNKCCFEALSGKSAPCVGCQVPELVEKRKSSSFERTGVMNPGKLEQVNIYHFDEKDHEFSGALMRIHDITESRLMERKMAQNEKLALLGFAISCISHEITNPVSAITFNAPILKDYINAMIFIVDDHAKYREDFELFQMPYPQFRDDVFKIIGNILHGSSRVSTIISDMRKLYGTKKQQKEKRWIDMKQLIERTNSLAGVEIGQYVESFEINVPENLPEIYTDPDAVEHVLTNLLINAAHAADKKDSWVKLDVIQGTTWKDHLIIKISDNGCGMDPETLSKIFDPFFSTKPTGRGSGLGMYISRDLVKELGGRIEVQSEPGKGSVFSVVFPDIERRFAKRV
ncbi:MAG: PAS domain-containing protein [Desulfobacterales bacterium]